MALFFRDPLFGRLEEYAFKLAKQRYIEKGVPISDDVETWSAEVRKAVRGIRDEIFRGHKAEVKQLRENVGSDYKNIVKTATVEALAQAFNESEPAWYSEERSYKPKIIAVPVAVIRDRVRERLPPNLRKPNQFRNPSSEVIDAIADDAISRYLDSILEESLDGSKTFKVSY